MFRMHQAGSRPHNCREGIGKACSRDCVRGLIGWRVGLQHISPRAGMRRTPWRCLLVSGASTVLCDDELNPRQQRNLEKAIGNQVRVGDRTALILDVFSQRAATREGKMQVSGQTSHAFHCSGPGRFWNGRHCSFWSFSVFGGSPLTTLLAPAFRRTGGAGEGEIRVAAADKDVDAP